MFTIHTHPSSMPPSSDDLNSCFERGYNLGFVTCHDGKVFAYYANEPINQKLYDLYIKNYKNEGYSEYYAQIKALDEMMKLCDFQIWEVKV